MYPLSYRASQRGSTTPGATQDTTYQQLLATDMEGEGTPPGSPALRGFRRQRKRMSRTVGGGVESLWRHVSFSFSLNVWPAAPKSKVPLGFSHVGFVFFSDAWWRFFLLRHGRHGMVWHGTNPPTPSWSQVLPPLLPFLRSSFFLPFVSRFWTTLLVFHITVHGHCRFGCTSSISIVYPLPFIPPLPRPKLLLAFF